MEARVAKLASGMDDVRATLARLEPAINRLGSDAAEIKGRLSGLASAADLGELKGRVASLPNVWQAVAINALTVLAVMVSFGALLKYMGAIR